MLSVRGLERYCVKSPSEKISLNFFIFFRFHILRFLSVFCWFMVKITHPSLRDVLMMEMSLETSLEAWPYVDLPDQELQRLEIFSCLSTG